MCLLKEILKVAADEDYKFYLEWLKEYADKAECGHK